ncbi:MAG TPA: DinB family protein [Gemmataceae bacterium]|nr:DinB family protein [Gemmataceae bacterium]
MTPELIDAYEKAPAKVRAAVAGLTRDELTARPGPGEWSILEVVVHLTDSDAISIDRMKRMIIEDSPQLLYADETAYVQRLCTHEQDLEDALILLEVGRRQFARVLRKLPAAAFERSGNHNRAGRVTVGGYVASYIKHIDDHLDYVRKKRIKLGKPLPEDQR